MAPSCAVNSCYRLDQLNLWMIGCKVVLWNEMISYSCFATLMRSFKSLKQAFYGANICTSLTNWCSTGHCARTGEIRWTLVSRMIYDMCSVAGFIPSCRRCKMRHVVVAPTINKPKRFIDTRTIQLSSDDLMDACFIVRSYSSGWRERSWKPLGRWTRCQSSNLWDRASPSPGGFIIKTGFLPPAKR